MKPQHSLRLELLSSSVKTRFHDGHRSNPCPYCTGEVQPFDATFFEAASGNESFEWNCPNCSDAESLSISPSEALLVIEGALKQQVSPCQTFFVEESQLLEAQAYVNSCECCDAAALISFDYLLDAVTGCDPSVTTYVMSRPAQCPQCDRELTEKTLVLPQ